MESECEHTSRLMRQMGALTIMDARMLALLPSDATGANLSELAPWTEPDPRGNDAPKVGLDGALNSESNFCDYLVRRLNEEATNRRQIRRGASFVAEETERKRVLQNLNRRQIRAGFVPSSMADIFGREPEGRTVGRRRDL